MAGTFVTSASGSSSGYAPSPLTISSVACGTAPDTIVIGWLVSQSGIANDIANMAVNGDTTGTTAAAAQVTYGSNDNARLFYWRGTGPGTVSVAFSWTGDISIAEAGVLVYSGVGSLANFASATMLGGTTSPSQTITSATGDLAVGIWVWEPNTVSMTPGAGSTERMDTAIATWRHVALDEAGAASVVVSGTSSATEYTNVRFGFSLVSAAAAATSLPPIPSLLQRVPALRMR